MQLTENFILQEFIPQELFLEFWNDSTIFISPKLPVLAQEIRNHFYKSMTINDWRFGGKRNYSGYRPPDCAVGAKLSRHKLGIAFDFILDDLSSDEIRLEIIKQQEKFMTFGLTAIEDKTQGWVHISMEWTNKPNIVIIPI